MVSYHKGDLLQSNCDVICHQTNCMGAMGAGIARTIRARYPETYTALRERFLCDRAKLGKVDIIPVRREDGKELFVVNMYAQKKYMPRGVCHTNYDAFKQCAEDVKAFCSAHFGEHCKIGFPYKVGCGLAGGDWEIVKNILETVFAGPEYDVEIWEL